MLTHKFKNLISHLHSTLHKIFRFRDQLTHQIDFAKIALLTSILLLISACIFIGINQSALSPYISRAPGDYLPYNHALQTPLELNDIGLNPLTHTMLVKIPLFLLENWFGLNQLTLTTFAIFTLLIMQLGVAYFIWKFSRKNKLVATAGILMLTSLTLTAPRSSIGVFDSWLTMRNIEIPLTIALLLAGFRLPKIFSRKSLIFAILLGLFFASDVLVPLILITGLPIFLALDFFREKPKFWSRNRQFLGFLLFSLLAMFLWLALFIFSRIFLFDYSATQPTLPGGSFGTFILNLGYAFHIDFTAVRSFANFLPYIPNFLIMTLCLFAVVWLINKFLLSRNLPLNDRYNLREITFLATLIPSNLMLFSALVYGDAYSSRFLVFVPVFAILATVFVLSSLAESAKFKLQKSSLSPRKIPPLNSPSRENSYPKTFSKKSFSRKIKLSKKPRDISLVIISSLAILLILLAELLTSIKTYEPAFAKAAQIKRSYESVVTALKSEKTYVLIADFSDAQIIKFLFDQTSTQKLKILDITVTGNCDRFRICLYGTKLSWRTPDGSRVAIFESPAVYWSCKISKWCYRTPTKTLHPIKNSTLKLWIYDYDIRADLKNQKTVNQ